MAGDEEAEATQVLTIPPIRLQWGPWVAWDQLAVAARSGTSSVSPPRTPGVYEVRREGEDERLTIGRASNLRRRVVRGLVMGKRRHSTGERIRAEEPLMDIVVRWAGTERPAAAEEELHWQHVDHFGGLPTYTLESTVKPMGR